MNRTWTRTRLALILLCLSGFTLILSLTPVQASDTSDFMIGFKKVPQKISPDRYTGLLVGPDQRLYGTSLSGHIYRWDITENGDLSNEKRLYTFDDRIVIGLEFDPASTPDRLLLWVTHNYNSLDASPLFSSSLDRLTGDGVGTDAETWTDEPMLVELPRSYKDHMANGLDFGPDGALYMVLGSTSAMGDADPTWNNRVETLLSATVLRIDTAALEKLPNLPLSVRTAGVNPDGTQNHAENYGSGDPRIEANGLYNPFAPGAPVTIYATGFRNPYDLVWTDDGQLYVPINGSAAGGNVPGTPEVLPESCKFRIDAATNGDYTGPAVVQGRSLDAQPDFLARVEQGGYYGHPNPTRCEWVLNGGNPTERLDLSEARGSQYPAGTLPDRNFRGYAYTFGLHTSSDGIIEYHSDAFNGELKGRLLVTNYNFGSDIIVLERGKFPGSDQEMIVATDHGVPGLTNLRNPLDLTEDARSGNLYVSEFGADTITLLRPDEITVVQAEQRRKENVNAQNLAMIINSLKVTVIGVMMAVGAGMTFRALWLHRSRIRTQPIKVAIDLAPTMAVVAVMAVLTVLLARDTVHSLRLVQRNARGQVLAHHTILPDPNHVAVVNNPYEIKLPDDGKSLFMYICATCHGPDATGMPNAGANLITSEFVGAHTNDELLEFVKVGRPANAPDNKLKVEMPARGGTPNLTDEQITKIIEYLRTLR